MKISAACGSILLISLLADATAADSWNTYRYPETGFQADFPAPPKVGEQQTPQKLIARGRTYTVVHGPVTFVIIVALGVPGFVRPADAAGINQAAMENMAAKLNCSIRASAAIQFSGGTAREAIFEACSNFAQPTIVTRRSYMIGDWTYTLMVMRPSADGDGSDAARFLNSFRLTDDPPTDTAWHSYRYADDGFEMELPASPAISDGDSLTTIFSLGRIQTHEYVIDHGLAVYRVHVLSGLSNTLTSARADQYYWVGKLAMQFGGECQSPKKEVSLAFPEGSAWEVTLDCGDQGQHTIRSRIYLAGSRAYILVTARMVGDTYIDPHFDRFLNSFKLLSRE
jgi:hypothetical protein